MFFHLAGRLAPVELEQIYVLRGIDLRSPLDIVEYESCTVIGVEATSPKLHALRPILNQLAISVSEHTGTFDPAGPCPLDGDSGQRLYIQGQSAKLLPLLDDFSRQQRSTSEGPTEVRLETHTECSVGCLTVWANNPAGIRLFLRYLGEVGFGGYLIHPREPETDNVKGMSVCSYH